MSFAKEDRQQWGQPLEGRQENCNNKWPPTLLPREVKQPKAFLEQLVFLCWPFFQDFSKVLEKFAKGDPGSFPILIDLNSQIQPHFLASIVQFPMAISAHLLPTVRPPQPALFHLQWWVLLWLSESSFLHGVTACFRGIADNSFHWLWLPPHTHTTPPPIPFLSRRIWGKS